MENNNIAGKLICAARTEKGWSKYRLCKEIGMQTGYFQKVEEGEYDIRVGTFERIANALGKTIRLVDMDETGEG